LRGKLGLTGPSEKNECVKAIDKSLMAFAIAAVSKGKLPMHTYTYDLVENGMARKLLEKTESISVEEAKTEIIAKLVENRIVSKPEDA